MKLRVNSLLLLLIFSFVTACGSNDYISAFDRTVSNSSTETTPLNEVNSESSQSEVPLGDNSENPETLLFDKILENSNVPEQALEKAFLYLDEHHDEFENQKWITIFDIKQHSGNKRLYIINMENGEVTATTTAHGKNSDPDHDGYATSFSNTSGSNKSSLGFMKTAETYSGKYGYSLRLDGLESRNDNVRPRAVVIHGANYVNEEWDKMGRSLGCPALDFDIKNWVVDRIRNGSLFYTYHEDYE